MRRTYMFMKILHLWMISLQFAMINLNLFILNTIYGVASDEEHCLESQKTVEKVVSCPINKDEWNTRAILKNCSAIQHSCLSQPQYHCVMNEWQNKSLEVCAPVAKIPAGHCAEYNTLGRKIQEYYQATCKFCKTDYLSTSAYKCTYDYSVKRNIKDTECYGIINKNSLHQDYRNTSSGFMRILDNTFIYGMCIWMLYIRFML